jgi:hypothetical protein
MEYIYGFRMIFRINSDYSPIKYEPTDICNGE